ncbi:hypothetical protein BJ165DRAFT_1524190 [Panaeolus papilionaceus]|nr:hypothetical protein BJ165DRAFT_1524190 [Panaeolus papilionaceus]
MVTSRGTVVLVDTTLVGWHVSSGTTQFPDKFIYQIQGHRVKVLSASDKEVKVYLVRTLPLPRPDAESISQQIRQGRHHHPLLLHLEVHPRKPEDTTIDLK